jgi:CO dehydrogenase/acetyl-CoA synthase delta subunit
VGKNKNLTIKLLSYAIHFYRFLNPQIPSPYQATLTVFAAPKPFLRRAITVQEVFELISSGLARRFFSC